MLADVARLVKDVESNDVVSEKEEVGRLASFMQRDVVDVNAEKQRAECCSLRDACFDWVRARSAGAYVYLERTAIEKAEGPGDQVIWDLQVGHFGDEPCMPDFVESL